MGNFKEVGVRKYFAEFLREKGVYDQFVNNLYIQNPCQPITISLLNSSDTGRYYLDSITWSRTPEGRVFWAQLTCEWEARFNTLKSEGKI